MAVGKSVFLIGIPITIVVLATIILIGSLFDTGREEAVLQKMNDVVEEYEEMQTLMLMSDFLGENVTCTALRGALENMNKGIWSLGEKIDLYRQSTEEFMKDNFYIEQKKSFNRKEALYFSMLKKMGEACSIEQPIVLFFYKKKELCPDCDAQSFVLSDIKRDIKKKSGREELAAFAFDADIELNSITLLARVYNVTSYPCLVIDEKSYCGLLNKKQVIDILCSTKNISVCK